MVSALAGTGLVCRFVYFPCLASANYSSGKKRQGCGQAGRPSGQGICLSVSKCLPETSFIGAGGVRAVRDKVRLSVPSSLPD